MYCTNCGQEMNDNQAICLNCGVKVGDGKGFCAHCGTAMNENADICLNCGVAANKKKTGSSNLNGQDKIVMILICFFLGGLGIHNFMMGETKKGVAKILLCFCFGISSILALIDLIKIATDNYEVNPEKMF